MSERINLECLAAALVADALTDAGDGFDADALREDVSERAHDTADGACIYYSKCLDLISDYERHAAAPSESELGGTYRADQYLAAAQAWACEIACAVLVYEAHAAIERIEEAVDEFCATVEGAGADMSPDDVRFTSKCPHGWAVHDSELGTDDGGSILVWKSRQLDGLNGAALQAHSRAWVSCTWEPEGGE